VINSIQFRTGFHNAKPLAAIVGIQIYSCITPLLFVPALAPWMAVPQSWGHMSIWILPWTTAPHQSTSLAFKKASQN